MATIRTIRLALALLRGVALISLGACSPSSSKPQSGSATGSSTEATAPDFSSAPAAPERVGKLRARIYAKTATDGTLRSDLLSAPCDPGATCTTVVMLPADHVLVDGSISLDGAFLLGKVTQEPEPDGVLLTVSATNRGKLAAPIAGMFKYRPETR